ncbi:MAG: ferredoxin [Acidimicrobiia bacterium]|nr:ferredoxin [Acidimicrobiia bacterium]
MRVWIDTDLCMGAGTCEMIEPLVFRARPDGLWAVAEPAETFGVERVFDGRSAPDGPEGVARVVPGHEDRVVDAAEACPGECVHVLP